MKIAETLVELMANSDKFTAENFGLKIGDTYPELVRECVDNAKLQHFLFGRFLISQLTGLKVMEQITPGDLRAFANRPEIFELPMSMLYWGIEIGRRLEREQSAALKATAAGSADE